ncbi:CPBP family intramembrane glutamic endopeptidase [Clostridium akagii]|uniref:CPBP family intramembrane glutamic endopeptidase n=1 Tax=Clostridium akagii TaxID=91623 RepID=UPI00047D2DB8|nr:type II CAAX endopeptidase family protein [Clostridium akagii]
MKKIFGINFYFLLLILLQLFGSYILQPFIPLLHKQIWAAILLTQFAFLIVPMIIYLLVTKKSPTEALRLKPLKAKNWLYVGGVALLVYPIATFLGLVTNLFFHNNVNDLLQKMDSLPLWAFVLVIALTPAICEEFTVRGIILSGYKKIGTGKAAIITGFMFGVLHLNPSQFLYTFVLGIILAYLVRVTDSIFASIICHFTFNGINAVLAWSIAKANINIKNQDITSTTLVMKISTLSVNFFLAAGATIGIVYIIKHLKKINQKDSYEDKLGFKDQENSILYKEIEYNKDEKVKKNSIISLLLAYSPIGISVVLYVIFALMPLYK